MQQARVKPAAACSVQLVAREEDLLARMAALESAGGGDYPVVRFLPAAGGGKARVKTVGECVFASVLRAALGVLACQLHLPPAAMRLTRR